MGHPLEKLSAYLDGELKPEESAELEQHLQVCTECQGKLEGYRQLNRHFKTLLEGIPVPEAGEVRVRAGKLHLILPRLALAATLVVAMGFMVPSVRAQVTSWFAGGWFSSRAEDTAARAAFKVYLPVWLAAEAKQQPVMLSDPDKNGRFQRVEFIWTGASESPETFLYLSEQVGSSQDLKELVPNGQPVTVGSEPGIIEERTWYEGERKAKDVRIAWLKDGITFFLQSGVLSSDDIVRVAQGMQPTSPVVAQAKEQPAKPGTWHDVGPVERFASSTVTHFPEQHFFLVRLPDGFVAFYDLDPHLRHLVTWDPVERVFVSPAHGERYTVDGTPIAGPAPRGLDRYPVKIENGRIIVDLGTLLPGTSVDGHSTAPPPHP